MPPHLDSRPPSEVDVLIIGGGVTGVSLAALLASNGKSVLLLEKRDFASGTSQSSGMMVWGGLLYLKNFEFLLVWRLCRARDRLIGGLESEIKKRKFTYVRLKKGGRSRLLVWLALQLYQAFSLWRRKPLKKFSLETMDSCFDPRLFSNGWTYEEGFLAESDSRYVLQRLLTGNIHALNYHEITRIQSHKEGGFLANYRNALTGGEMLVHARNVVNCGGVWAEEINAKFQMNTQHTHYLSKGVYLLLPISESSDALVMDMELHDDTLCWVPWGEVVMWGPTETKIDSMEEAFATAEDVDFLLERLNSFSRKVWKRDDIINVRCGVRPLVNKSKKPIKYPLDLSRYSVVEKSSETPWWTVFGGKLSGAADLAAKIYQSIYREAPSAVDPCPPNAPPPMTEKFFGGREVPDPAYCREFEQCRNLEDYLRRRTNLAQWIPNAGFGENFEFHDDLIAVAGFLGDDAAAAKSEVWCYRKKIAVEKKRWYEK